MKYVYREYHQYANVFEGGIICVTLLRYVYKGSIGKTLVKHIGYHKHANGEKCIQGCL